MTSQLICPDCHGGTCAMSGVPGLASCQHCGQVFPVPDGYEPEAGPSPAGEAVIIGDTEVVIPDQIGVETGWRAWGVSTDDLAAGHAPLLKSVTHSHKHWTPRQPTVATCEIGQYKRAAAKRKHDPPDEGCSCGLYSAKSLEHLLGLGMYHKYDENRGLWTVVGRVKLWGKVIEGSQGWRAEIGYPDELYVPYEAAKDLAEPLEAAYGVEVGVKNWLPR